VRRDPGEVGAQKTDLNTVCLGKSGEKGSTPLRNEVVCSHYYGKSENAVQKFISET